MMVLNIGMLGHFWSFYGGWDGLCVSYVVDSMVVSAITVSTAQRSNPLLSKKKREL